MSLAGHAEVGALIVRRHAALIAEPDVGSGEGAGLLGRLLIGDLRRRAARQGYMAHRASGVQQSLGEGGDGIVQHLDIGLDHSNPPSARTRDSRAA